jgi:KUP system potassium uptake protein
MVTATFSLIHQLIGMKSFPSIRVHFTSRITAGQVYIPAINWLLCIGTVATVGGFGSSFALTLAYGFAVATVMICTTVLISIQIPFVKHLPWAFGVLFFLFFGFFDGLFWGGALIPSHDLHALEVKY